MAIEIGEKLGRYEIRQKIGEGGMGEVFLAYDSQLDRNVVLKILLPKFLEDVDLVRRFKQEAKAVSALNHPNIITIHEIVEAKDFAFIVYEFIKGETLRDKIRRNQLSTAESVRIVEQIAGGLLAAHKAGIIHRDIKPENIMIRDDGYVKILDFGLAKRSALETDSESRIADMVKTKEGMIMGSVQYMSPEQARGEKMDERTDIWSLGAVFYEMVTGVSPFAGKTIGDSIAMVLKGKPRSPSKINKNVPLEIQKIISKTLVKKREERCQSIQSLLSELKAVDVSNAERVSETATLQYDQKTEANEPDISTENTLVQETDKGATAKPNSQSTETGTKRFRWRWIAAVAVPLVFLLTVGLAITGIAGWVYYNRMSTAESVPFQNNVAERLTKDQIARLPAISPDGKLIAFVRNREGKQVLMTRRTEGEGERELFEAYAESILDVAFTPNGENVNFVLQDYGLGSILQIPAIGGEPKILLQDVRSNASYSPDGKRIAFVRFDVERKLSQIVVSNADGSFPNELINTKDSGFVLFKDISWTPDGKNLLMVVLDGRSGMPFKYNLGTIAVDSKAGKADAADFRVLEKDGCCLVSSVKWLNDGSGVLMLSRKQDDKTRQIYFVSYPDGVSTRLTNDASNYSSLDVSEDGTKIIAGTEKVVSSLWEVDLEASKSKQISEESEELDNVTDMAVAENGFVYYSKVDLAKGTCNIFYFDPKTVTKQQFTLGGCIRGVSFSADRKYILTSANLAGKGQQSILRLDRDARNPIQITKTPNVFDYLPQGASGGTVYFNRMNIDGSFPKLMKVGIDGGEAETVFTGKNQLELYPKISPDGNFLVYNEFRKGDLAPTSSMQLKVIKIDNGSPGETVFEKRINQPTRFSWSADGRFLYYVDPESLMNVKTIEIQGKNERPVTEFASHSIYGPPAFSVDGKTMYLIRTSQIRDLVLIKDADAIKKLEAAPAR